jgi:predicted  nucleic acid-binding Zn-ribbon protein
VNSKVSEALLSLSELDKEAVALGTQQEEIEERSERISGQLSLYEEQLSLKEQSLQESSARRQMEESRLQEEEKRIAERRRQLTEIGGAKSAKLVEREIDIATRSMEGLEERALLALKDSESLEQEVEQLRSAVEELKSQVEQDGPGLDTELDGVKKELSKVEKKRSTLVDKLDTRLKNLYSRVRRRYPSDAVAVAKAGACRSCFRALPSQTYNQIIAGNMLIQCPGCSRILVYGGESEDAS